MFRKDSNKATKWYRNSYKCATRSSHVVLVCSIRAIFFGSIPVFEFFLAGNCVKDIGEVFVIDEAAYVVLRGMGIRALLAVLFDADTKIVGESDVQTS